MNHTVLLVDDDPNILTSLQRAFRKEPFAVLGATSAVEALMIMHRQSVDVVVSDEEMPGMRGSEFLSKVRTEFPSTFRFVLSGRVNLEMAIQAINRGDRFFTKPSNAMEIALAVRQALRHKELLVEAKRLLGIVKRQSALIERLAGQEPSLAALNQADAGQNQENNPPDDPEEIIHDLQCVADYAEDLLLRLS